MAFVFKKYHSGGGIIDTTALPAGGGTPVIGTWAVADMEAVEDPTTISPEVENIYFNTGLSTEEVIEILSKLTFTSTDEGDIVFSAYGANLTAQSQVALGFIRLGTEYAIMSYVDELIMFATDGLAAEMGTTGGWNPDFNGTYAVNGILVKPGEATPLGLPVDNQQEKYAGLMSLTPGSEPADIDEKAIYRITEKVDADVYYRYDAEEPDGYLNLKAILASEGIACELTYYVLDAYPESPEVTNLQTFNPGHVYIINDIPQVYGDMGSGNMWVTVTDMLISAGVTTIDCGFTADITKETQPGTFVTYKDEVTLHYYKDGEWHGGGGGGIIDVTELPGSIDENAVYRLTKSSAEVYVVEPDGTYQSLSDVFNGKSIITYVVETVPENPTNGSGEAITVYVVESTGVAYLNYKMSVGEYITAITQGFGGGTDTYIDGGWTDDIDAETEVGVYCVRDTSISLNIFVNGAWESYVDDELMVELNEVKLENENLATENENITTQNELLNIKVNGLDATDAGTVNFAKFCNLYKSNGQIKASGLSDGNVRQITIPEGVDEIVESSFSCNLPNNENLESVTIKSGVIGRMAFEACPVLASIVIDGATIIGENAFSGCRVLTNAVIRGATSINHYAFEGCISLTNIVIPDSVTYLGRSFENCTSLMSMVIGNGVTRLVPYLVGNCTNLTDVTIPHSVTIIDDYAFSDCSNLTNIVYNGTKAQWKAITFGASGRWDWDTGNYIITCTDGTIAKDGTET